VMALLVGLVTLRISGMFFVVFGFGLSELMREVLIWWEINRTKTLGRYVFVPFDTTLIYWHLLGLAVLVFLVGWLLRRSRLGIALLVIGDDETMARQAGINVPLAKVAIFVVSSVFMTAVGAVMAPRFGYLTPNFVFNPLISFQVVIMALLGGMQRLWGPVLGIVPLILLSELLQVRAPFWYSVILGLIFMVIVYFLPRGVTGLVEDGWQALRRPVSLPRGTVCWKKPSGFPAALPISAPGHQVSSLPLFAMARRLLLALVKSARALARSLKSTRCCVSHQSRRYFVVISWDQ